MHFSLQDRLAQRPLWLRNLLCFIGGSVATLALPPAGLVPALFIALPLLVLVLNCAPDARAAFAAGWFFGAGYFFCTLYWLIYPLLITGGFLWAVPLAVIGMPAFLALFTGAASYLGWRAAAPGWRRIVALAIALSLSEWLRGHILTGFPWMTSGYVWSASTAMMQPAALFGVYGLGFITLLMAALPATLDGHNLKRPGTWAGTAAAALLLVLLALSGGTRLTTTAVEPTPDIYLRLVQANIPQSEKWRADLRRRHFNRYMNLSESGRRENVTHVIWPETAIPYFINESPARRVMIGRLVPSDGAVITGGVRLERAAGSNGYTAWNSAFAISHFGEILASYDKSHLVPFGEYIPLRPLFERLGLHRITPGLADFQAGEGLKTLHIEGLPPVGPLICYEVIFPGSVVDPHDRPAWLLNLTNDAWYGSTVEPYQHLAMTRFRAVEEGLPVVRVAGTGISAVIDPLGRINGMIPHEKAGILDFRLPQPLSVTPYARLGDSVYFLILAMAVVMLYVSGRRRPGGSVSIIA